MSAARLVLFIALRQIGDRKALNGIAVLGVALGVLTLVTLSAIMQGFQMKFKEEIIKVSPHVTVSDRRIAGESPMLVAYAGTAALAADVAGERPADRVGRVERPYELIGLLESIPDVEAACANLRGQAMLSLGAQAQGVEMRGVKPAEQERCTPLASYVTKGSWDALAAMRDGIVLGSGLATRLGAKVGERVRIAAAGGKTESLVVVAIMDVGIPAIDNVRTYVNLSVAQSVLQRTNDIGHLEVRLRKPFESSAFARRIERVTGYESEGWEEANANFLSLFKMQSTIVRMVIGAVLTLGGFGILSMQIMIVLQKTRDIAILRSVGFRRLDILAAVIIQGTIVALLGAAIGDLAGYGLVEFLSGLKVATNATVKSSTFLVYKDPVFYVYGTVFALFVGVLASIIPALRASRVAPVAVLRGLVG
jgi:lipoprotein-releasing system permease protein